MMTGRLEGKVALITGAAGGVGRAQAIRFAQEGADIIAVDLAAAPERTTTPGVAPQTLADTVRAVEEVGRRIRAFEADVRDQRALDAAVAEGVGALGRLDVLCATAGISSTGSAVELDAQRWQTMLDVNLTGVWRTCKAGIPAILAGGRGGSLVLMSSIAGLRGLVGVGHYTTAKHGVVGLMRSLANELAPHAVRVNTIHPAIVRTPMIENPSTMRTFSGVPNPTREQFEAGVRTMHLLPLTFIEPEDVANASLFLASDEARCITGVTLPVDAGHCLE